MWFVNFVPTGLACMAGIQRGERGETWSLWSTIGFLSPSEYLPRRLHYWSSSSSHTIMTNCGLKWNNKRVSTLAISNTIYKSILWKENLIKSKIGHKCLLIISLDCSSVRRGRVSHFLSSSEWAMRIPCILHYTFARPPSLHPGGRGEGEQRFPI